MCGRSCCTLSSGELQGNGVYTCVKDGQVQLLMPKYVKQYNLGKTYEPSFNIAPSEISPVLVSRMHLTENSGDLHKRSFVPMMWGIVPRWHKGDYLKHGFHTNNCRLENLMDNRVFKPALMDGQRCVVVCEGFYEWSTTTSEKTPYFVHARQKSEDVHIEDRSTWPDKLEDLVLLKMAALFDIWTDANGDQLWSYTILTRESDEELSWLHHRTPVFLDTEEQVNNWLDYTNIPPAQALAQLTPVKVLAWHQVSKKVNNSRYKIQDCNKPAKDCQSGGGGGGGDKKSQLKGRITSFFLAIRKEGPPNEKKVKVEGHSH